MITERVSTVISNSAGEFGLMLFSEEETGKEHLAMIMGQPQGKENILCRIHPECFTGDVLNSNRCDCHDQFHLSMELIQQEQRGILIYLPQEGRGIGLANKLQSHQLRDKEFDIAESNGMNGPEGDKRAYDIAVEILKQLEVKSVRLLTDKPTEAGKLQKEGIPVTERVPFRRVATELNNQYLSARNSRLHHSGHHDLEHHSKPGTPLNKQVLNDVHDLLIQSSQDSSNHKSVITVSYAQSLDGSITLQAGEQFHISGRQSLRITHGLRAMHDAILIGVGTVLADDPLLTTRLTNGQDPKPVIVDSRLRTPFHCKLLQNNQIKPIVATTAFAGEQALKDLQSLGAEILFIDATPDKRVDIGALLRKLYERNIKTVMVEGGSQILTSFFNEQLVDILVLTIAPQILGGLPGIKELAPDLQGARPNVRNLRHVPIGKDLVVWGAIDWTSS